MILEKEQIHRYMRHIIMPEISGIGQKKLLEASVLVYCKDLLHSAFMLYYLTAMGIGKITCQCRDASDSQHLLNNLKKLNPDVSIMLTDITNINVTHDVIISFNQAEEIAKNITTAEMDAAFILAASNGGKGFVRTVAKNYSLPTAINECVAFNTANHENAEEEILHFPSSCLIGVLAAIEAVKSIIEIGSLCEKPLFIDLSDYSFSHENLDKAKKSNSLTTKDLVRILKDSKALIVGTGGLGSPAAYILAQMGIGKLGLVDFDTVDISNLNRQILHATDKIGMPKVESAKVFLKELNPAIEVCTYEQKFSIENAESLVKEYDIIIDGLDNLPTRYLLNDTCYFLKKPLVEAGVLAFNGLATVIVPDEGPCYRCTFPEIQDTSAIPSCSETGVLGAVPGIMGALQAIEVIKQLTGIGESLLNKLVMFDAMNAEFTKLDIYKEDTCPLCGSNPTIDTLKDYNFVCSSKNNT